MRKGDLIVQIEDSDYRAALEQAEAGLAAAQANLANLANQKDIQRSLIRQAQATIAATTADLERYTLEAKRQRDLVKTVLRGHRSFSNRPTTTKSAPRPSCSSTMPSSISKRHCSRASMFRRSSSRRRCEAARAQVKLARNNLDYTRIVSPADGLVGQRQVRAGQFVNVGTQVIAVVPLPNIWVIANFKETQMTNVREGNPATVTVDAFPDLALTGRVDSWSPGTGSTFALLPPDNATGNFTKVVQRVPVKIVLDPNPALGVLVRPGMSVEATVDTGGGAAAATAAPPQSAGQAERPGNEAPSLAGHRRRRGASLCRAARSAAAARFAGGLISASSACCSARHGDARQPRDDLRSRRPARRSARPGSTRAPGSRRASASGRC